MKRITTIRPTAPASRVAVTVWAPRVAPTAVAATTPISAGRAPALIWDCRSWASLRLRPVISVLALEGKSTTGALITSVSRKMATIDGAAQAESGVQPSAVYTLLAAVVILLHSLAPEPLKLMSTVGEPVVASVPTLELSMSEAGRLLSIFQWYPLGYRTPLLSWLGSKRSSWSTQNLSAGFLAQ